MHDTLGLRSRPERITVESLRGLKPGRRARPRGARPGAFRPPPPSYTSLPLRFVLPFLPPSVNRLFTTIIDRETGATKRALSREARRIRRLISLLVRGALDPSRLYEIRVDVHLRAFTRAGAVRQVDVSNRVKFLEDCVCQCLGIDDRQIFRVVLTKHHSEAEHTVVEVRDYSPETEMP
jgi:Holliday junction resolvase RusA-like endonuclease